MKFSSYLSSTAIGALLITRPIFRRVWFGELVSAIGDNLTWVALAWFVLELTNNNGAAVGVVLLCFALPSLFTGVWIGRLLDRYQPRTIMIIDNLGRGLVSTLLPTLYWLGILQLWMVYALALCAGALAPATRIGSRLLVPWLVEKHELEAGNAALSLTNQLPAVLAPALAGVLVATWGAASTLWLDGLSFFVLAWALLAVPNIQRQPSAERQTSASSQKGVFDLPLFRQYKLLAAVWLMSGAFFFAYGPLEVGLPILVKLQLQTDASGYGLLWTACGIGMVIGGLGTTWLAQRLPIGLVLGLISAGWGICQILIAYSPNLAVAVAAMLIGGVIWGPYLALEATLAQRLVPAEQYGQVFGMRTSLLTPMAPLGTAVGGGLLSLFQPPTVIALGGCLCLAVGMAALTYRPLRNAGLRRELAA